MLQHLKNTDFSRLHDQMIIIERNSNHSVKWTKPRSLYTLGHRKQLWNLTEFLNSKIISTKNYVSTTLRGRVNQDRVKSRHCRNLTNESLPSTMSTNVFIPCGGGKYFLNVLFNDVEICQGYIASGMCEWIEVKHWWNDIENLSQCHLVNHTTHMEWPEFKAGRPQWDAAELTPEPLGVTDKNRRGGGLFRSINR